jgi:hypothetical protein
LQGINRQSGYGFIHYPVNREGIIAAMNASKDLQDTTVESVNYKSSLSHKLTTFIEETTFAVPQPPSQPQPHQSQPQPLPQPQHQLLQPMHSQTLHSQVLHSQALHSQALQPQQIQQQQIQTMQMVPQLSYMDPRTTLMPSQPVSTTNHLHYGHPPPHYQFTNHSVQQIPSHISPYPPQLNPFSGAIQASHYRTVPEPAYHVVTSVMPMSHPFPPRSPQIEYAHFPAHHQPLYHHPSTVSLPGFSLYPGAMPSPAQSGGSPQTFYVNDNLYTPSSISSVDTIYDQMVGNLVVSPPDNSRTKIEPSFYGRRSSPLNDGRIIPAPSSVVRQNNNNNNFHSRNQAVNLRKVRERSMRNQLNEFDSKPDDSESGSTEKNQLSNEERRTSK